MKIYFFSLFFLLCRLYFLINYSFLCHKENIISYLVLVKSSPIHQSTIFNNSIWTIHLLHTFTAPMFGWAIYWEGIQTNNFDRIQIFFLLSRCFNFLKKKKKTYLKNNQTLDIFVHKFFNISLLKLTWLLSVV